MVKTAFILSIFILSLFPRDKKLPTKIGVVDMEKILNFFMEDQAYLSKLQKNRKKMLSDIKQS